MRVALLNSMILFYQRFISPHKGFRCAYSVLEGGYSCSEYVRRVLLVQGPLAALNAYRRRSKMCKIALNRAQAAKDRDDDKSSPITNDCKVQMCACPFVFGS